jgi:hypothetical protein
MKKPKKMVVEKRGSVGVPLPTSDEKYGLQTLIRSTNTPPSFYSRVELQVGMRVPRNPCQQLATPLCFSTNNHTFFFVKKQVLVRFLSESWNRNAAQKVPVVGYQIEKHSSPINSWCLRAFGLSRARIDEEPMSERRNEVMSEIGRYFELDGRFISCVYDHDTTQL